MIDFLRFLYQFYKDSRSKKLHPHLEKCIRSLSAYRELSLDSVPWMCYSLIDFLEERLSKEMVYFEYGSGASTIFFSQRVKKVVSVDHDSEWHKKVKKIIEKNNIENVFLSLENDMEKYPSLILKSEEKYHIILIDGKRRNECIKNAILNLSESGIIIFDNSGRSYFKKSINFLKEKGFNSIKFNGLKPGYLSAEETTIFYRDSNILNI